MEKESQDATVPRMSDNIISLDSPESPKNELSPTTNARINSNGTDFNVAEEEPTDEEKRTLRRGMLTTTMLHIGRLRN